MHLATAPDGRGSRVGFLIGNAMLAARLAGQYVKGPLHLELELPPRSSLANSKIAPALLISEGSTAKWRIKSTAPSRTM